MSRLSIEDEICQVDVMAPHVVILGAGASRAAFPDGDKNGKIVPIMKDFIEILKMESLFDRHGINYMSKDFEKLYSEIYINSDLKQLKCELEERVYEYFYGLEMPDFPTLYDHLVLSLRKKDVIATFNWDPFLVEAILRNKKHFDLPHVLFLHGNVAIKYCKNYHMVSDSPNLCPKCGRELKKSPIIYPVQEKGYEKNIFIIEQWNSLKKYIKHSFMITIFGYRAPESDTAAISLMKEAWGDKEQRFMEEFEIINIEKENELMKTWSPFIHTHHYQIHRNFYDSWIANHPRRTGEAFVNQYVNAYFITSNPLPKEADFEELWNWFKILKEAEERSEPKR